MKDRGKTIKRIADEIGVSKTTIRKRMDEKFRELYTYQDDKGVIYINFDGEIELKKTFNALGSTANQVETAKTKFSETTENFEESFRKPLETTENQFAETPETKFSADREAWYMAQIDSLREENKRLQDKLLELSGQVGNTLTAITQGQLADKLIQGQQLMDEAAVTQESEKKTFWNRLFGK